MKNNITIVLICLSNFIYAQVYEGKTYVGNPSEKRAEKWNKEIADEINSETVFIFIDETNKSIFNSMKEAFKEEWKDENYEFKNYIEIEEYIGNPKCTFICEYFEVSGTSGSKRPFLGLARGNEKYKKFNDVEFDAAQQLPCGSKKNKDDVFEVKDYSHLAKFYIVNFKKELQRWETGIGSYLSQKVSSTSDPVAPRNVYINNGKEELIKRTIYICENDLVRPINPVKFGASLDKNFDSFNVKYKIVSKEEFKKAIDEKNENVAFVSIYWDGQYAIGGGFGDVFTADDMTYLGNIHTFDRTTVKKVTYPIYALYAAMIGGFIAYIVLK